MCTDNHGQSPLDDLLHVTQSVLRATSMPAVSLVDWLLGHVSAKSLSVSDKQPVETAQYQGCTPTGPSCTLLLWHSGCAWRRGRALTEPNFLSLEMAAVQDSVLA
jgi:hypothetical protein